MTHPASANPKQAMGAAKLPLNLWPATATAMGCLGILEGREKYGQVNWRATPVLASTYIGAVKRHIEAYSEGEEYATVFHDDDGNVVGGIPHLANALANLAILVDAAAHGTLIDDRNFAPVDGFTKLVDQLTPAVPRVQAMFAEKKPKHYTIADKVPAANDSFRLNTQISNIIQGDLQAAEVGGLVKKSLASEMAWK